MAKKNFTLIFVFYCLILIFLFLYSFTQVDLNLTLSQASILQSWQKFFLQIGYFQRPFSTVIFLTIIFLFAIFYFLMLHFASKNKISPKQVWWLVGLTVALLLFSYPAFSHDLFNYLFDARIFTKYQLNPYFFKPLDFPYDPWTRFMHWTHRNYPYGPTWLILTLPFSYLGFGKFLLTALNFKVLMSAAYVGTIYLISKILAKISPKEQLLGMVFFAFNPLVIIESLVSAHHDLVMMFFALLAIYLVLAKKKVHALSALAVSVGIKYVTATMAPLLILGWRRNLAIVLSIFGFLLVIKEREIQPWYFLWVLPWVSLTPQNKLFTFLSVGFSLGLLLRYAPFLYFGHWDNPVPQIKIWVTFLPTAIALAVFAATKIKGLIRKSV